MPSINDEQTLQLVVHVLHASHEAMKPTDIAKRALHADFRRHCVQHGFNLEAFHDEFDLGQHFGRCIARHLRTATAARQVVAGSRSAGWTVGKGGMSSLRASHQDLMRPADTQFSGLVGEYAVMSELLACNWNVAKLPHDDGVDIVATKSGQLRTVQVKTAHAANGTGKFTFNVQRRAHEAYDSVSHYYVLVLRRIHGPRYINEFLILNSRDIHELTAAGAVPPTERDAWQIVVRLEGGLPFVENENLSTKANRFGTLFR